MKCVSYVRTTCFDPTARKVEKPITEQTEHIRAYVKKRHWCLSKRYSDRKDNMQESTEFMELKKAALKREFDCVIVDSITRFGADVYQTLHFLKKTYYPAGLHFAVVEDDFCSLDHTTEEVYAYLEEKRAFIHGRMTVIKTAESAVESYFSSYGFRYYPAEHRVELDEPTAEIIKEVYSRLIAGELPHAIAKDMTERGIENPSHYYCRQRGWAPRRKDPSWNVKCVHAITKNPKYMGKWECIYDLSKLDIRCGAIVDPATYEAVQEIYRSRQFHSVVKRKPAPYANLMWDKETGMKVCYFNNTRTRHSDVRFKYPKQKDVHYERPYMPYDEFHEKITEQLLCERHAAKSALAVIRSESGIAKKNEIMQPARDQFQQILCRTHEIESRKLDAYRRYKNGEISSEEYLVQEKDAAKGIKKLDNQVETLIAELAEIDRTYSEKNPWIRLFSRFNECDALIRKKVLKYVEKVYLCRFASVELVPKELEWKQALPQEWLKGDTHGENE